ncbi:MAG: putative oxidoreductase YteT [Phycisphaerae bacterium]|nr:putative oxidoreductase YteT [Phycisphaerae bacterium]
MSDSANGPVTVALIGAGHRTIGYARYALSHADRLKVVAVAEPDALRRRRAAEMFGIPVDAQFAGYEQLADRPRLADAAINGTMDPMHHPSSMPLLQRGYHLLLEKPIARTDAQVRELIDAAAANRCTVMICHVLRYAPFYTTVRRLLDEGRLGNLTAVRTLEAVSYHHMAVGFIRGRWRRREVNPMLLAKCCHDLDIIAWLKSGVPATRVASFGGLTYFRPENAPPGAGKRCLTDCRIEPQCPYSAKLHYLDKGLWRFYAWECIEHLGGEKATAEQKLESLRTDNPFGRCVWHCDNDVADHQTVVVDFADGTTATHEMWGGAMRPTRQIHLMGTLAELEGDMESGIIRVRTPSFAATRQDCDEEVIDVNQAGGGGGGHGGGDERLIADFVATLRGESASRAVTRIEDSYTGHQIAFAADTAMRERRVVELAAP